MNSTLMKSAAHTKRQQGAVLIVSMILLLVMTILALTVSQSSLMQERMAGNIRDSDLSFQAAEASLRGAEQFLWSQTSQPIPCSTAPCTVFQKDALGSIDMHAQTESWWDSNGREYGLTGSQELEGVKKDPRVVIEELGFTPYSLTVGKGVPGGRTFYRNTAHGFGGTKSAQTVIVSTFTRPY